MKKLIMICTIIIGVAGLASAAPTIVIDFESLANLEIVDDQFLALGADFGATTSILQAGTSLNPLYPPYSGVNVIFDDPALGTGIIRIDAVGPLWAMAGGYVTGNTDVTMTAYSIGGTVLGSASTGGANFVGAGTGLLPNILLSVAVPGIAYVEFSDSGNMYVVDDFTHQAIPAPGAILLGGIGMSLVGWLRRRRTL